MQEQFEIENGVLKAYLAPDAEVAIPEGVHTIGDGVFKGMSWLLKVTLPSTLKKIGDSAFKGCRQLNNIVFPEGLAEIGEYAFHRCHGIKEMIFPKTVTTVKNHAFLYCDGLKKAVLEGPEHLERAAFSHNLSLEEIHLNGNLDDSNFADEVFEGCVRLARINLSGKEYAINNLIEAMDSDSGYPKIIRSIAKSVYHSLQIEDGVLYSFHINLKSISIPEGITEIGKGCFFDKKGILNITFPKSLRKIRANAFLNCTGLQEITIQNDNVETDDKAFRGCCSLKKVNLSGKTFSLEDESDNETVSRIREQVLGDFYISGRVLIRYKGNEEHVRIPKEVEIIGERCFFENERIKAVTCSDNLREIREQAFAGCVALQNVVLSDNLKRVEREAFAECKKLLKINLPDTVEYIGEYAFRRCFSLKSFERFPKAAVIDPFAFYKTKLIDNVSEGRDKIIESDSGRMPSVCKEGIKILSLSDVTNIGKYAYDASPDLEELVIDAPECVIEREAFSNCPKLKRVRLNVKEIREGAFSYCRKLEEVSLSGVTVLPERCFAGCYSLIGFEAKDVKKVGPRCFDECVRLPDFDFTGIEVIGERAFERCDSLRSVELNSVECGFHAFADCASLESVEISEDTVLKSGTFIGSTQIKRVRYNSKEYVFSRFSDSLNSIGNTLPGPVKEVIASIYSCFEIVDRKILTGYRQDASRITIPEDIEEVGQDVFRDHVRLKDINIPKSVKLFGSHAFSQTMWLDEQCEKNETVIVNEVLIDGTLCSGRVLIPSSVKRIASWCFAGNIDITELEIPSERIAIEALAFRNCINLKKIIDPEKKEYILYKVSDLSNAEYPEQIQKIFSECINCFKLDEMGNLIESTGNITDLTFPDGIKAIGDGVYKDCHLLESISLSNDTELIGKSAFENSKWLNIVKNAGSVTVIGAQAFSGCQSLESIDLSNSLKKLGNRCFEHCSSLKAITVSNRLEKIPERAFFRCKSLTKLQIPESVRIIEPEAFAFCDNLEDVYISSKTVIDEKAFAFCDRVRIHIGD